MPKKNLSVQGIAGAMVILMVGTALSTILGILREVLTSYFFGASRAVDTYLVAGILPNMFSGIVAISLTIVTIPALIELRNQEGEAASWLKLASPMFIVIGLLLIFSSLITFFSSSWVVRLLAPGFEPDALAQSAALTRILSPSLFFVGLSGLLTGVLQSYRHFLITAMAPMLLNIGMILAITFGARTLGIEALAIGYLLGVSLQFIALLGALLIKKPPFSFQVRLFSPRIKALLILWLPLLVATAADKIDGLVNRMVASTLQEGSISGLYYANLIFGLLPGFVLAAIGSAFYPSFAEASADKDLSALIKGFSRALRISLFFIIPGAGFLVVFAYPITQLFFQRGAFNAHDTWVTATALQIYAPSLIPLVFTSLGFRVFYALKNTITPLWVALCSICSSIAFNLTLVRFMDHRGLALATVLSSTVAALLCSIMLSKRLSLRSKALFRYMLWLVMLTVFVSITMYFMDLLILVNMPLLLRLLILLSSFCSLFLLLNLIPHTPLASEVQVMIKKGLERLNNRFFSRNSNSP